MIARGILEKDAVPSPNRSSIDQKIGDYYAACLNEALIEKRGIDPIKPLLDSVGALTSKEQLAPELVRLQPLGVRALFRFDSEADPKTPACISRILHNPVWGCPIATTT